MFEIKLKQNATSFYLIVLTAVCLTAFAIGYTKNGSSLADIFTIQQKESQTAIAESTHRTGFANMGPGQLANLEQTVADLTAVSDTVVRVVIKSQTPRTLTSELPAYANSETSSTIPIEAEELVDVEQVGTRMISTIYTDSEVELLEVYKGSAEESMTIMQLGNVLDGIATNNVMTIGNEYVLFLKDISGDEVHAPDRTLYRPMNPWGVYTVVDNQVIVNGENHGEASFPTTLDELEAEINQ